MIILPLLALLSQEAAAAERGLVAGLYAGGWRYDPTDLLETTWTAVPRVGYQLAPRYTVELDTGYMQGLTHFSKSYSAWSPRLNLLYSPLPSWPVQPFVAAGPGLIYKDINRSSESDSAGSLGLGGYVNPDLDLLLNAGPGLRVPLGRRLSLRGDLRFALDLGTEASAESDDIYADWEWSFGLMLHPGPEPPAPEPELAEVPADPPPEPELAQAPLADSIVVDPAGARIWIPHPVCRWVSAAEADALLTDAGEVRVTAPGYLPAEVTVHGPTEVALEPAPAQGSLVLLASPGDQIQLGDQVLTASGDGSTVINAPLGPLTVSISGGGRAVTRDLLIASGFGLWVRVPAPEDLTLRFDLGVSALDAADIQQLQALAEHVGGYRFRVRGSYSPEGDPGANEALALARGQAAGRALTAAGVPPDRVVYDPPQPPPEGDDPEALRAVLIHPEPTGGAP